jgi:hypothetical protein
MHHRLHERRTLTRADALGLLLAGGFQLTKLAAQKTGPSVLPPTNVRVTAVTETTITLAWDSTSLKFSVYQDGAYVATVTTHSYTFSGLVCEDVYSLGVKALSKTNKPSTLVAVTQAAGACPAPTSSTDLPPPDAGFLIFADIVLPGNHLSLPDSAAAAALVTPSTWEPRPLNTKRNHIRIDHSAASAAFAARPLAVDNNYDSLWDSWLLPRVDGAFSGTTDEIFQWAAFKWGLPDNLLRAIAVRESTWYQYLTYSNGRPVVNWGCGDMFPADTTESETFLNYVAQFGHDYQQDFGKGLGPKTYSIIGCMSWEAPSWGQMPNNQNGTFPFTRDSTAFAVDYLAGHLRGVYEGWEHWLNNTGVVGTYTSGDIWGAVGSWYSGDWHSTAADGYISRVQSEITNLTWLQADWPTIIHSVDPVYGAPQADTIPLQTGETVV